MTQSDQSIFRAVQNNENWAFKLISERITPLVKSKLFLFEDWEDVRQQCVVAVLTSLRKLDRVENLWALVRKIAVCKIIDHNRRHQLTRAIFTASDGDTGDDEDTGRASPPAPGGAHDDAFADQELFLYIYQRIGETCQRLFQLLFIDGLTFEEAADVLEIRRGTLRVRLKRCRDRSVTIRDALHQGDLGIM